MVPDDVKHQQTKMILFCTGDYISARAITVIEVPAAQCKKRGYICV